MEEEYNYEVIETRSQILIELLQDNFYDFTNSIDKEEFIIELLVNEFKTQAIEFESIYALKIVLEGIIDDYELNVEEIYYKIHELINSTVDEIDSQTYFDMNDENSGYIYLMVNPSMKGIVKIGLTRRTPEERLEELSKATGVPTPFILVFKEQFRDCVKAEKLIHSILEERNERVSSNREFFSTETSEAIKIIQQVKETLDIEHQDFDEESSGWFEDIIPLSKEYLEMGLNYLYGYEDYLVDYERAIENLEKAGELGEAKAYYELGNLYINILKDKEITLDVKKAIRYFEKGRTLTGEYSNYCNAGLAICYVNSDFTYTKVKNYIKNEANAEKCWKWFFNNLDFHENNTLDDSHIRDFISHFMVNDEVSDLYKNELENIAYPYIKRCRYRLYSFVKDFFEEEQNYLLGIFTEEQLEREVEIHCTNIDDNGTTFEVEITKGFLNQEDILYINLDYDCGKYRTIKELIKNGIQTNTLQLGEKGVLIVDSVGENYDDLRLKQISLKVIGSELLETDFHPEVQDDVDEIIEVQETENEVKTEAPIKNKGILSKVKSWFS